MIHHDLRIPRLAVSNVRQAMGDEIKDIWCLVNNDGLILHERRTTTDKICQPIPEQFR